MKYTRPLRRLVGTRRTRAQGPVGVAADGQWYPFVPAGGTQQRDSERELQIKANIDAELPIEPELDRWFPLWGIPI